MRERGQFRNPHNILVRAINLINIKTKVLMILKINTKKVLRIKFFSQKRKVLKIEVTAYHIK